MAEREATTPRARDSVAVGKENNDDDDDDVDAFARAGKRLDDQGGVAGDGLPHAMPSPMRKAALASRRRRDAFTDRLRSRADAVKARRTAREEEIRLEEEARARIAAERAPPPPPPPMRAKPPPPPPSPPSPSSSSERPTLVEMATQCGLSDDDDDEKAPRRRRRRTDRSSPSASERSNSPSSSGAASPPPAAPVDPFVSIFAAAMAPSDDERGSDSDADVDASSSSSSSSFSPIPPLPPPAPRRTVVLDELAAADALWNASRSRTTGGYESTPAYAAPLRAAANDAIAANPAFEWSYRADLAAFEEARRAADAALRTSKHTLASVRAPLPRPMAPYESLPLNIATERTYMLRERDFKPLKPMPEPPAAVKARMLMNARALRDVLCDDNADENENENDSTTQRNVRRSSVSPPVATTNRRAPRLEDDAMSDVVEEETPPRPRAPASSYARDVRAKHARAVDDATRSRARARGEDDGNVGILSAVTGVLDELDARLAARAAEAAARERAAEEEREAKARERESVVHAIAAAHARAKSSMHPDALTRFERDVEAACEDVAREMMTSMRFWHLRRCTAAATRVQKHYRGRLGRREASERKRIMTAGLAYMKNTVLKVRFSAWVVNADYNRRSRILLEAADARRVWGRRAKVLLAWRERVVKAKEFYDSVERLFRAVAMRDAAPLLRGWREEAAAAKKTRLSVLNLMRTIQFRCVGECFAMWSENAAAAVRARVLDTKAHARALAATAAAIEDATAKAHAADDAAERAANLAADGKFHEAQLMAEKASAFASESARAADLAEERAKGAGPENGAAAKQAWDLIKNVRSIVQSAKDAAAGAASGAELKAAADAFFKRHLARRFWLAWAGYTEWLKPLRSKAGRALSMFRNSTLSHAWYKWLDLYKREKEERETTAVRAYMAAYQGLIKKHIARPINGGGSGSGGGAIGRATTVATPSRGRFGGRVASAGAPYRGPPAAAAPPPPKTKKPTAAKSSFAFGRGPGYDAPTTASKLKKDRETRDREPFGIDLGAGALSRARREPKAAATVSAKTKTATTAVYPTKSKPIPKPAPSKKRPPDAGAKATSWVEGGVDAWVASTAK